MPKTNRILIIDDTEVNRYAFSRILRKEGYQTLEADGVTQGLKLLDAQNIDMVILDVQMPDGSGFDVCVNIKNDPALSSIPVLMTSASFVHGSDIAQGLDSGAEGYLTTPIDPQELVATVRSLLRVRDAERKLKDALEKAEAANIAKTDFLANMSHEIRTPMNAIIGITHLLARTSLSQQQQKLVSTLQESSGSLMNLINDLLDITKIEDNMIELEATAFSLQEVTQRIVNMMSMQANKKGLELRYKPQEEPDSFIGDAQRLYQVLLNIVSNAIKFTESGTVTIETKIKPLPLSELKEIQITVTDTGIGIPPEKLEVIFNKFTQADNSTTRKYGGSGLGLAIAKRLIEQMQGSITVKSTPGTGTAFIIKLQLKPTNPSHSKPKLEAEEYIHSPVSNGRILLVEDYAANILVAATMLEDLGYKCTTALNGTEALELFKKSKFDVILMDIQMHDMDGYEATRRLRQWEKENSRQPVPVIAVTAHVLTSDREKCLAAGMDDYLSKPINSFDLEKILAKYIPQLQSEVA